MPCRLSVFVSALALIAGFVVAPHVHRHPAEGVRHAHLPPHATEDSHEVVAVALHDAEDHHGSNDVLASDEFVSASAGRAARVQPAALAALLTLSPSPSVSSYLFEDQPRSHGPPAHDGIAPRAPPIQPAI